MADDPNMVDVAKPGNTPANPTSRPIIVGQVNRIKDPMVSKSSTVTPVTDGVKADQPATPPVKRTEKVLNPVDASTQNVTPTVPAAVPGGNTETVTQVTTTTKAKDDAISDVPVTSEEATVDAVVEEAVSKKNDTLNKEPSTEEKAQAKHVQRLIDEKVYFLPIGKATRKKKAQKNMLAAVIFIVLLLGLAAFAYIQGLIKLPV